MVKISSEISQMEVKSSGKSQFSPENPNFSLENPNFLLEIPIFPLETSRIPFFPISQRMQKRAERFNVPVSLESKKAARAAR